MNRIDRLHAILTHLQSRKLVTAQQIADRFSISLRTVYRDVKALEESGIPIIGEAGQGYSIMEGYRLPPVMFTQEEAGALLFSNKLAAQLTDSSLRKHLETALYKIKAVLRTSDKEDLDSLDKHIEVMAYRQPASENSTHYLSLLQRALVEKKVVNIEYYSAYSDKTTKRALEPIGLCYYSQGWHLIAWCRLRKDYRDFRLTRVQALSVADEVFESNTRTSLQEYMRRCTGETELQQIIVLFDKTVVKYIADQKYYHGFVNAEEMDDQVRMYFLTAYPDVFCRWLLMFTDTVRIESPASCREKMTDLTTSLSQHYISEPEPRLV